MAIPPDRVEETLANQLDSALDEELLRVVGAVHLHLSAGDFSGIIEGVRREADTAPVVWRFDEASRWFDLTARPAFLRVFACRPELERIGLCRSPSSRPPN